jgi:hypothetical protein
MKTQWNDNNTMFADGTGTLAKGWYAITESSRLSKVLCNEPDAGPFETIPEAFQWLMDNDEIKG